MNSGNSQQSSRNYLKTILLLLVFIESYIIITLLFWIYALEYHPGLSCNAESPHTISKRSLECPPGCRKILRRGPQYYQSKDPRIFVRRNNYSTDALQRRYQYPGYEVRQEPSGPPYARRIVGEQGLSGPQGAPGFAGTPGLPGERGSAGQQGLSGARGSAGAPGLTGARGPAGSSGLIGGSGSPGLAGASGSPGAPGLAGAMGVPGLAGSRGSPGAQGLAGHRGSAGEQGLNGYRGLTGVQGLPGREGMAGQTGSQGPRGQVGPQGSPGSIGGEHGYPHSTGYYNRRGDQGNPEENVVNLESDLETKELKFAKLMQELKLHTHPRCVDALDHQSLMSNLKDKGKVSFMIMVDLAESLYCIVHT